MDVKSAFLNGKLSEEVYVEQPPGFESSFQIKQVSKGISICQEKYVKDLLKKYDLADCASVKCLMLPPNNFGPDESRVPVNEIQFRGMIGYQANPKESHLVAVKRIFRKSTSEGCHILRGKLVCWSAKKQTSVAMSSTEAEYVAAAGCCAQVLWIKRQLADYDVLYDKVHIFCDNTSVIAISNNPVLHSRTKHIDIRYHFIRDHILKGDIELHFVPTDLQLADIFTKPLAEPSFTRLVAELDKYISNDLTLVKPHTITAASFQKPPTSEISLTSHMLKVAKICQEPEKYLIPSSEEKKIPSSSQPKSQRKVRITLPKKQVAETQHAEVKVATTDATKSLEAFVLAEEQENQPSPLKPKSCWTKLINKSKLFKRLQRVPMTQTDYESMPEDHLRSISGFEDADSDDIQGNNMSHSDHTFPDHNASAKRLSLPDHLDHICEEVSSLHSKLDTMESSIIHQVSDGIKCTLPAFVTTALQEQLRGLLSDILRDCLPSIIHESMQTYIQASSEKFTRLETKLSMGKSVTTLVKSGMKEVRTDLKSQANDIQYMQTQLNDIQSLLESAVIINNIAEGEKNKKAKDPSPATTQGEPQSDEPLVERPREQPADLNIKNKESAPSASDAKQNEGKELVVHKSEEIISVEDDSNEDDKKPLSKRFKIMTLIPDIPNPTPRNTFVPEHLLKPKEQQKESSKGKAVTTIEEPGNELVKYQEEGGSNLKMPKLKSFITPEGPISQEEYNNQIKEIKRLKDLKAEQEKSKQDLTKLLNPATLKAQAEKWIEHEAKKAKMMEEYKRQISFRANILPITKISYVVNSKEGGDYENHKRR
nr:hypothetical protein [Tanacetum cinerariifolium]